MTITKRDQRAQKALLEFSFWAKHTMNASIVNVLILKRTSPAFIQNPVLTFVVPRAMNYVVERFSVEVVQAYELLNKELKRQKKRLLGITNKDYRHLKRIRNKLVAHKIEESLRTNRRYEIWYKKTYGNFETVLSLIARVAKRIADKVDYLEKTNNLQSISIVKTEINSFSETDIEALLGALKEKNIF